MPRALIAVLAAAALAAAAWLFLRSRAAPPAPPPAPAAAPPATAPPPPDAPLPPAADSDARVRGLFGPLSPRFAEWLSAPDLLERGAAVIDNLAEDVSPRKQVPFLAPAGAYEPHRFERYDFFAAAIGAVDTAALASAVRAIHPLLEAAYHRLGYPDRRLDAALLAALRRIAGAPVVDAEVRPRGDRYVYVDPGLEALGPVEKHLLRMGPRNERVLQEKARALADALAKP